MGESRYLQAFVDVLWNGGALAGDHGFGKGGNGSLQMLADAAADLLTQIVQSTGEPERGRGGVAERINF